MGEVKDIKKFRDGLHQARGANKSREESTQRIAKHLKEFFKSFSEEDIQKMINAGIDIQPLLNIDIAVAATNEEVNKEFKDAYKEVVSQILEYVEQSGLSGV